MNKQINENRQAWIDALRSGRYQKGIGKLQIGDEYCCLGVACKVYEERTEDRLPYDSAGEIIGNNLYDYKDIVGYFGLRSYGGFSTHSIYNLVDLNDYLDYTFNQIADELETGNYWEENNQ